jgi:hypothetical protein
MPSAPPAVASAAPDCTISREELEEYRELAERHKCLEANLATRRRHLVAKVKLGVKCEIGPWIPQLVRLESRRFSAAAVERALGKEVMEEIRAGIAPTVTEVFGLIPREGWMDDLGEDEACCRPPATDR